MGEGKHTLDYEAACEAVRAAGFKLTPWRVGREMGCRAHAAFWLWSDAARAAQDWSGRPVNPSCPYAAPSSVRQWESGFRKEVTKPRPARTQGREG